MDIFFSPFYENSTLPSFICLRKDMEKNICTIFVSLINSGEL